MVNLSEKEIENQILHYLSYQKDVYAWKNQTTGIFDPKMGYFRRNNNKFHIKGVSDILGIAYGKMIPIEVKSKKGRSSPEQTSFIERINSYGGYAIIAKDLETVIALLDRIRTNEQSQKPRQHHLSSSPQAIKAKP